MREIYGICVNNLTIDQKKTCPSDAGHRAGFSI